ncbi:nucleoside/nucleotide kinase family protein [uncultured Jatrophihabitans sp.]|uniref:nucleoside/nucleotide kinase family protein n=1 Tax=uncultured Jatrophihabitans sp. TaxID=1610747 RepID=UPI0035CC8BC3
MRLDLSTAAGAAVVELDRPRGVPRALLVLTHGAGGGVDTPDLLAIRAAALRGGVAVARVLQPYRVAGRASPTAPEKQDAAWLEVVAAIRRRRGLGPAPLIVGGRSNGARVACRTALASGAVGVLALAFPLHPPGRPANSRLTELAGAGVPVLVVQGERDPFGMPPDAEDREVVVVPGADHSLKRDPTAVAAAAVAFIDRLLPRVTPFVADATLDPLVERVLRLRASSDEPRVLIGLTGPPGAGKTTLAQALVARFAEPDAGAGASGAVVQVPMDGFHLADVALDRLGLRDRKGAPETFDAGGYAALLRRVRAGEAVWAPAFERVLEQPIAQSLPIPLEARVVVSEGNYLLLSDPPWPDVRAQFAEVWFCRVDRARRRERLIARHIEFGKSPRAARDWVARTDDPNAELVDATMAGADLVVDL